MRKIYHSKLAETIHATWSGWMSYFFLGCTHHSDRTVTVPKSVAQTAKRWARAPYLTLKKPHFEVYENEVDNISEDLNMDSLIRLLRLLYISAKKDGDYKLSKEIRGHIITLSKYFKRINL